MVGVNGDLEYLQAALEKNRCKLFVSVLMTNHVHLLEVGEFAGSISGLMQTMGRRYVRYCIAGYKRTGTLFEGRFKSSLIDSDRYFLAWTHYIELNPVRAGMASCPENYRWSSYHHHVADDNMAWLADPAEYLRLASTPKQRAQAYRALFTQALAASELEAIRVHINKDCALGSAKFQAEIELVLGRRANIVQQGWPKKNRDEEEK